MSKTVVVALDGSEFSGHAVPVASHLAERFGAELVLATSVADGAGAEAPSWLDAAVVGSGASRARGAVLREPAAMAIAGLVSHTPDAVHDHTRPRTRRPGRVRQRRGRRDS